MMGTVKPYDETHQRGYITIENVPDSTHMEGDLGIQIARDGRVWVCINGLAFVRFRPKPKEGSDGETGRN